MSNKNLTWNELEAEIFTPEEIKEWQDYQAKYNDIQQSVDAYKMQVYKEADKVRKQWEKDGVSFSDTDLMLQVLEKVKAIDEAEKENNSPMNATNRRVENTIVSHKSSCDTQALYLY